MANALRTLLARKTSANGLVPECHVEVWTVCPLSLVGGERCLQLIARSRLPISYDLQLYPGKGSAIQQYVSGSCISKRVFSACTRIRWRSEARSSSSQQVCNVLAVVLLEKAGRT